MLSSETKGGEKYQEVKPNLKYSYYLHAMYDVTVHYTNMHCAKRVAKEVSALLLLTAEGIKESDDGWQC
jgi:hypothetical protein